MGRSAKRYQNAAQLLPKPLLRELQHYAAGLMLYVPYPVTRREFNRLKVLDLRMQGYTLTAIARRLGMSRQNVCRILKVDRQRALTILALCSEPTDATDLDHPGETGSGETPPPRRR